MFGIKCHTLQICLEDSQQETDLDLPMSVQESLVVEWLVVPCCGVGVTDCSSTCLGPSEEGHLIFITSIIVWPQLKKQGGNTALPCNRKLD